MKTAHDLVLAARAQCQEVPLTEAEAAIRGVHDFWFAGEPGEFRKAWFAKDDAFDAECRAKLGPLAALAAKGDLKSWLDTEEGSLALILLLDQAPRNLHRGTAQRNGRGRSRRARLPPQL